MPIRTLSLALSGFLILAGTLAVSLLNQKPELPAEPEIIDGELVYTEGTNIPKFLTETEQRWLEAHPARRGLSPTPAPEGEIRSASEYEAMDGIVLAWEGGSSFTNIVAQMAAEITTTGDANVYVAVDSSSEATSARNSMIAQGADGSRVHTVVRATDTIWIRDYGPRYIFEGGCRAVVDHNYNRPRPNDDDFNSHFADWIEHGYYRLVLTHGGGNYHLNSTGISAATRLISNENPGYSDAEIWQIWMDYLNVDTELHTPFPTSVDYTQHIDMWMQVIGENEIIISDWPSHSGSTQDVICDAATSYYQSLGWTVHRTPAYTDGWTHYTFTNMVICNDLVLLPRYTSIASSWSTDALAVVQAAMHGKTIVQIVSDNLAYSAGVMHCICMHVPANSGGVNPVAYLRSPNGGELYDPGDLVDIKWISDDDESGARSVDIKLSTDSGNTFTETIVTNTDDDGNYVWTVPDIDSDDLRLRIVVYDSDANYGFDDSNDEFSIDGTAVLGDANGDGTVNVEDLLLVIANWGCAVPGCQGDVNGDGVVNVADLLLVIANWPL